MRKIAAFAVTAAAGIALVFGAAAVPVPAQATTYLDTGETSYVNVDGKWVKSYEFKNTYNKKKQLTSSKNMSYDAYVNAGAVQSESKSAFTYDGKGRRKTVKSYENGTLKSLSKYSYSGSTTTIKNYQGKTYLGKEVEKGTRAKYTSTSYNAKGKKTATYTTNFDSKGNVKSSVSYENGKLSWKSANVIKGGKIVKSTHYSYDKGKLTSKGVTEYSYSGKYTTSKDYDSKGNLSWVSKYYTEAETGHQIQVWSKSYYDGKQVSETTYKVKKYASGKLKGIVKEVVGYSSDDNSPLDKTVYKVKAA